MAAALWKGLPLSEISSQRNPRFSSEHGQVITNNKYSMKKLLSARLPTYITYIHAARTFLLDFNIFKYKTVFNRCLSPVIEIPIFLCGI